MINENNNYIKKSIIFFLSGLIIITVLTFNNISDIKEVKQDIKSVEVEINDYKSSYNELNEKIEKLNYIKINQPVDTVDVKINTTQYIEYSVPTNINTSFKAYMPINSITDETSDQYKLKQECYVDDLGFCRINDDYMIALGTYYTSKCGERFLITTDTGEQFTAIIGDIKQDIHTNNTNQYVPMYDNENNFIGGNIVEFIIDDSIMCNQVIMSGTVSSIKFKGNITEIKKIIEEDSNT